MKDETPPLGGGPNDETLLEGPSARETLPLDGANARDETLPLPRAPKDRPATASGSEPDQAPRLRWEALPRGQIGAYHLERELARGGMGAVFRARHTELERPVAVKILLAGELATPEQRERFRLEAQATARLRHPNVVAIHDVGEERGIPYLVMDLVEGRSLGDRLEEDGPLPPREVATLGEKVALALQAAHEHSILHRDVKPANILLAADGEPLLTDFGLAKLQDSALSGPTASGQFLGTPAFMSPEQFRAEEVDARADVYGLGATLYALLTGEAPFEAERMLEMIAMVLKEEPRPPSSLRPEIPPALDTICLTCLEKEPRHRYDSALALAEDLGRFLRGESIAAQPPSVMRREWDAVRQNRPTSRITNVALVALALAFIYLLWILSNRSGYQMLLAELDSRSAVTRARAARGLSEHPGPTCATVLLDAARRDESPGVRLAALSSLEVVLPQLEKPSQLMIRALLMTLEREDLSEEERASAWRLVRAAAERLPRGVAGSGEAPPQSQDLAAWRRWLGTG